MPHAARLPEIACHDCARWTKSALPRGLSLKSVPWGDMFSCNVHWQDTFHPELEGMEERVGS